MTPGPAPVVIIGAARSGTNMLRDALTALPGFVTWPCDEIPYIWRHGNRAHPDDEFDRSMARPAVRRFIRAAFARRGPRGIVVEKTCANSLRVGFVDEVLPDARLLVVVRHGLDATASAMLRWRAGFDLKYSLAKARFVPPGDLPYYAARYLGNRTRRLFAPDRRLAVWGPVCAGLRELSGDLPLAELAARQWRRCVERTDAELAGIDPARVHRLRYEEFVAEPAAGLTRILDFLGVPTAEAAVNAAVAGVRATSVGSAVRRLSAPELAAAAAALAPLLAAHGYAVPEPRR